MDREEESVAREISSCDGRKLERLDFVFAAAIFLLIILQGRITVHEVGISWDEPNYYRVAGGYITWAKTLGSGDAWSAERLDATFGIKPKLNDHPTLTKLIAISCYAALKGVMGGFWAYRFSAPLLFGILLGLVYLAATREWGRVAGGCAALCVAAIPRLFVHMHIAATDGPLCLFWFASAWAFYMSFHRRHYAPLAGLLCGLTMSVKFTGFTIFIPLAIWAAVYNIRRPREVFSSLVIVAIVAPVVFLVLQPFMWDAPIGDLIGFVKMSVSRAAWNPYWVLFLGKVYNFSPPWYYAPFMVLVTVPEIVLIASLIGAGWFVKQKSRDRFLGLCIINMAFFIAVTFSPNAPVFDGVRLFLPAFLFLGVIAGYGLDRVFKCIYSSNEKRRYFNLESKRVIPVIVMAVLCLGAISPLFGIYPYGLEYYNGFIGGVNGARRRGMETTYWWTVLNGSGLARVNRRIPHGAKLRFSPMDSGMWTLYKETGLLDRNIEVTSRNDFDYVLVLSRPFWNFGRIYKYLNTPPSKLLPIDDLVVDGVPFWVLYERVP